MVAGFQDDVDLEDRPPSGAPLPSGPVPSKNISLSSEEEAEEVVRPPRPTALAPQQCPKPETKRFHTKASQPQGGPAPPRDAAPPWPDNQGPKNRSDTGRPAEGSQAKARASSSESDPEGPIAAQMLSFVMDDPDFESGESDTQRRVAEFPVREDPSDVTDEDTGPAQPPPPPIPAFRVKSGADLFGLGPEEPGAKESSDEGKAGKAPCKEKRRKKRSKEEEDKAGKKSRAKGKKEEGREERRRRKKERKALDELEAFLGGGAPSSRHPGGGDYEEL